MGDGGCGDVGGTKTIIGFGHVYVLINLLLHTVTDDAFTLSCGPSHWGYGCLNNQGFFELLRCLHLIITFTPKNLLLRYSLSPVIHFSTYTLQFCADLCYHAVHFFFSLHPPSFREAFFCF